MDLLPLFQKNLHSKLLIQSGDKLVLAVSGGIDSMVLFDLIDRLREALKLKLIVAHLNHNVRGRESAGDARWVETEARQRKVPFEVKKLARGVLKKKGLNFQEEARRERYLFLAVTAQKYKAAKIVTAHQADDQVETFLMRLIRGAGVEGLKGIAPEQVWEISLPSGSKKPVKIVRPLLPFSREQILSYAEERGIAWREDRSNRNEAYLRNRIRRHLLAEMKKINPRVVEGISQTLALLTKEDECLGEWAEKQFKSHFSLRKGLGSLDGPWLFRQPEALRYRIYRKLFEGVGLSLRGIHRSHLQAVDQMVVSKNLKARVSLPRGFGICLAKNRLVVKKWGKRKTLQKRGFFY